MKEMVLPRRIEQERAGVVMVLNQVEAGKMAGREAAGVLGFSQRHVRRLLVAYIREGAQALAHGNPGRKPHHALDKGLMMQVLELAQLIHDGCSTQHLTELPAEREGIAISRSSVHRTLLEAWTKSPRKRRPPKYRSRRERYPKEGRLLRVDGSRNDWLEGRRPWLSIIGDIDDANGKVPYALFRDQEDAQATFSCYAKL